MAAAVADEHDVDPVADEPAGDRQADAGAAPRDDGGRHQ